MTIVADIFEEKSGIPQSLKCPTRKLDAGDYHIYKEGEKGNELKLVIERKHIIDLCNCIKDGRAVNQLAKMKECYPDKVIILMVEGLRPNYTSLAMDSIFAFISKLSRWYVIELTTSREHIIKRLVKLDREVQEDVFKTEKVEPVILHEDEPFLSMLQQIPAVGGQKASVIKSNYKNMKEFIDDCYSGESARLINLFTLNLAKKIQKFITKEWS